MSKNRAPRRKARMLLVATGGVLSVAACGGMPNGLRCEPDADSGVLCGPLGTVIDNDAGNQDGGNPSQDAGGPFGVVVAPDSGQPEDGGGPFGVIVHLDGGDGG